MYTKTLSKVPLICHSISHQAEMAMSQWVPDQMVRQYSVEHMDHRSMGLDPLPVKILGLRVQMQLIDFEFTFIDK